MKIKHLCRPVQNRIFCKNVKRMMTPQNELVIILHGIATLRQRMILLNRKIKKAGFDTLNVSYPSTRLSIEESADFVQEKIAPAIQPYNAVHFVTHSLGGLVALKLLLQKDFDKARRVVLIGIPYYGSEVADFVHRWPIYGRLYGPAGGQLTTAFRKTHEYPPPPSIDVGVIAGTRGRLYTAFLPIMYKTGVHDGVVSVQSTEIPWATDHITIRASHTFLIERSGSQVVQFLMHGCFKDITNVPKSGLLRERLLLRPKPRIGL
jgi:pimeloyl-ACP methyl ester carboxylesterase